MNDHTWIIATACIMVTVTAFSQHETPFKDRWNTKFSGIVSQAAEIPFPMIASKDSVMRINASKGAWYCTFE